MSGVRDPAFWKRFSTAVHMDEESTIGGTSPRPALKHEDSWLGRQQKKQSRRTCICWSFWFGLFGFCIIVVIVIIFCVKQGYFEKLGKTIDNM